MSNPRGSPAMSELDGTALELRDLFPLGLDLWAGIARPRFLNVINRRRDGEGPYWDDLPEERDVEQRVVLSGRYGAKAHGQIGCVSRLKRALQALPATLGQA